MSSKLVEAVYAFLACASLFLSVFLSLLFLSWDYESAVSDLLNVDNLNALLVTSTVSVVLFVLWCCGLLPVWVRLYIIQTVYVFLGSGLVVLIGYKNVVEARHPMAHLRQTGEFVFQEAQCMAVETVESLNDVRHVMANSSLFDACSNMVAFIGAHLGNLHTMMATIKGKLFDAVDWLVEMHAFDVAFLSTFIDVNRTLRSTIDKILDMVKEMIITHTEVRIGFHFEIKSHHTPNAVQPRGSGWKELEQRMERTVRFTGPLVQILSEVLVVAGPCFIFLFAVYYTAGFWWGSPRFNNTIVDSDVDGRGRCRLLPLRPDEAKKYTMAASLQQAKKENKDNEEDQKVKGSVEFDWKGSVSILLSPPILIVSLAAAVDHLLSYLLEQQRLLSISLFKYFQQNSLIQVPRIENATGVSAFVDFVLAMLDSMQVAANPGRNLHCVMPELPPVPYSVWPYVASVLVGCLLLCLNMIFKQYLYFLFRRYEPVRTYRRQLHLRNRLLLERAVKEMPGYEP